MENRSKISRSHIHPQGQDHLLENLILVVEGFFAAGMEMQEKMTLEVEQEILMVGTDTLMRVIIWVEMDTWRKLILVVGMLIWAMTILVEFQETAIWAVVMEIEFQETGI